MTTLYAVPTIQRASSTAPQRAGSYTPQIAQTRPSVTDDYERWYTETAPNNRMLLSLRSGIETEVAWALDRLCRLCNNEQFILRLIPGLTDALFEWPAWYVKGGSQECAPTATLFSLPPYWERRRRYALESLFILRNAAMIEPNAKHLSEHGSTQSLILLALHRIRPDSDINTELLLYAIELLQTVYGNVALPPPDSPYLSLPIAPLVEIAGTSKDRSLIIASLTTLDILLSIPMNVAHLTEDSLALEAAIKYLPLFQDKELLTASVNYLYTHLSHPLMSKAFLLHPMMPATLRVLVSLLLAEQVEETISLDISGVVHTVPAQLTGSKDHELTKEEMDSLVATPEPQRCYDWMRAMFVAKPDGELTQVDFWNLYKDTFAPYQTNYSLLVASDVIKNVSLVFPQAQAMVLPGPPQRFIVRGVDRRKDQTAMEQFKCLWDRSQCSTSPYGSTSELFEHILHDHINSAESTELSCLWATCSQSNISKGHLRGHVLTHLPNAQPPPRDPLQSTTITLPSENYPHPVPDPTLRPPPPPRSTKITYKTPIVDPPSTSLTALLAIRLLFRASFASSDAAPRADEDHFGFPGIIEELDEEGAMQHGAETDLEREGERRGRKAFIGVRYLMEGVRIRDEALMGWITEMVDAGLSGTT